MSLEAPSLCSFAMANCKCGIWMFEGLASCEAIEIVWLGTHWTLAKTLKREKQWQLSNADLILADRFGPTDGQAIATVWLGTHYELLQRTCEERKAMTTIECWLGSWWLLWAYRWRSDWNCMAWHSPRALAKNLRREKQWQLSKADLVLADRFGPTDGQAITTVWLGTHYELLQRTCEERKAMTTIECWLGSWWPLWAYRWRSDWNCMAWHSLRALAKTLATWGGKSPLWNADLVLAGRLGPTEGQAIEFVWLGTHTINSCKELEEK